MKKALIAGAASAVLAAMPIAGVFADDVTSQVDTLRLTISPTCTISSVTHQGSADSVGVGTWSDNTLSATVTAGASNTIGASVFNIKCNNNSGWNVTASATALTGVTTSAQTIPLGTPAANTAAWSYTSSSSAEGVTANKTNEDPVATATGTTGNAGKEFTVTYAASTDTLLSAQAYQGTITYTLAGGAYVAG